MAKPKKPFMSGYKTYDPEVSGYGSSQSWRAAFTERMGIGEARERVGDGSPEEILGVPFGATWAQIRTAYKKLAMEFHPDRAVQNNMSVEESTEAFKRIVAAYTILESRKR